MLSGVSLKLSPKCHNFSDENLDHAALFSVLMVTLKGRGETLWSASELDLFELVIVGSSKHVGDRV